MEVVSPWRSVKNPAFPAPVSAAAGSSTARSASRRRAITCGRVGFEHRRPTLPSRTARDVGATCLFGHQAGVSVCYPKSTRMRCGLKKCTGDTQKKNLGALIRVRAAKYSPDPQSAHQKFAATRSFPCTAKSVRVRWQMSAGDAVIPVSTKPKGCFRSANRQPFSLDVLRKPSAGEYRKSGHNLVPGFAGVARCDKRDMRCGSRRTSTKHTRH